MGSHNPRPQRALAVVPLLGKSTESSQERFDRFLKVKASLLSKRSDLESVYDYVAPSRVNFERTKDNSANLTATNYNSIAVAGVRSWANSVQSILMPPYQRWFKLSPGNLVTKSTGLSADVKNDFITKLEEVTEQLFNNISNSNFYNAINESLQDLAVSTGVLAINESSGPVPFAFTSIPLDHIYFEEGENNDLVNFWREIWIKARYIEGHWKNKQLKISSKLREIINSSPDTEVKLIEASIFYQDNEAGSQHFFYVQDEDKNDLLTEFREYSPFIGFRINKRPGDVYGYSVAQECMPDIRVLNLISLYVLRSAKFKAFPAFLGSQSTPFNPYTTVIEPGSIIPVMPNFYNNPPIAPLETGGDPQFAAMSVKTLEDRISKAFLSSPLGDVENTENRTATEMQLRQQNWLRENASGIGRLASELIKPVISTCLIIMRKQGLISDFFTSFGQEQLKVDNELVWIDYKSPLLNQQSQEDYTNLVNYIQTLVQIYGPTSLAALENEKIFGYFADKIGVPQRLIKNEETIAQILEQLTQAAQQPSLAQQTLQQQAQGEQPGEPQMPSPQMPMGESQ